MLCAWGITTDGKPHPVGLAAAASESTDAWRDFLQGLVARAPTSPLLVVSDGAPGLIAAIEQVLPGTPSALRGLPTAQRCRQGLQGRQDAFKSDWWEVFDKIEEPPGDAAVPEVRRRMDGFRARWEKAYPGAVACLAEDFESLTVHLRSKLSIGKGAATPP